MARLEDQLRTTRCRCIAERRGYKPNTPEYSDAVRDLYSQAVLVQNEKKTHIVLTTTTSRDLSALRTITAQLALKALTAGASPNEVLQAISVALDSAAEAAASPIERVG